MFKKLSLILIFVLSACVYRIDIQQGNILAQKDIDKLRPDLTKNQVVFVLGSPVLDDGFEDNTWIYLYSYHNAKLDKTTTKKLTLTFKGDKLVSAGGDYDLPESLSNKKLSAKKSD